MKSLFCMLLCVIAMIFQVVDAREPESFDVDLGEQTIRVPVPEGYLRASRINPDVFAKIQGTVPRGMRMDEFLLPAGDYEIDDPFAPPIIQVMVKQGSGWTFDRLGMEKP